MIFVLADKYMCINSDGKLYVSSSQHIECLWLNESPRLKSAIYSNIFIELNKNCKLNILLDNNDSSNRVYSIPKEASKDVCSNSFTITSGFSPELQVFFLNCQSSVQKLFSSRLKSNLKSDFSLSRSTNIVRFDVTTSLKPQNEIQTSTQFSNYTLEMKKKTHSKVVIKKCYKFRKTPNYRKCMNRNYKCFKFKNDTQKYKSCKFSLRN
jgi:hypothetical protein